jgi:hypothetical protein
MGRVEVLQRRIEQLEATVRELERSLGAGATPVAATDDEGRRGMSRRAALTTGAAAFGAAAIGSIVRAAPAEAADGDPLLVGRSNSASSVTNLSNEGSARILVVTDFYLSGGTSCAVKGLSNNASAQNGIGGLAVRGDAGTSFSGFGVVAEASREGSTSFVGKTARAQLFLRPDGNLPSTSAISHVPGEIVADEITDSLWYCTEAGTPGTWRKLSGPGAAGAVHVLNPTRVYDSRFVDGPTANNASRVVSVADAIDISTGAISQADLVPEGATGVMFNIAVVNTVGVGFLSVTPGDATGFDAASINWFGSGQILNNGSMSSLDANQQLKVWSRSSTNFVIDITGYTM